MGTWTIEKQEDWIDRLEKQRENQIWLCESYKENLASAERGLQTLDETLEEERRKLHHMKERKEDQT